MKLFLLFSLVLHLSLASYDGMIINEYFDEALKQFLHKVAEAGDDFFPLENQTLLGGFMITAPKVGNLSTLIRVGAATMTASKEVVIKADISFGDMVITGEKIEGPINYTTPNIAVRNNRFMVKLSQSLRRSSKPCWETDIEFTFYYLLSVVLNGMPISDWLDATDFTSSYIKGPLEAVFAKHFNFCEALADKGYMSLDCTYPQC